MMHPANHVGAPEAANWQHFMQFGLHPPDVGTQLYDGIDYVFVRSSTEIVGHKTEACHEAANIRLLTLEQVPCDLCAYARVMGHLGYQANFSHHVPLYEVWPYKTVVFMNTGVRGPLIAPGSSHWMDVLGMSGQRQRPLLYKDELEFKTIGAASISWEAQLHAQSYFLVIPLAAQEYYFTSFSKACHAKFKQQCIGDVEVHTIIALRNLGHGFKWFSFLQNVTVEDAGTPEELRRNHGYPLYNPTHAYSDPCRVPFIKFGGVSWGYIKSRTKREVLQLASQMLALVTENDSKLNPPPPGGIVLSSVSTAYNSRNFFQHRPKGYLAAGEGVESGEGGTCRFYGEKGFSIDFAPLQGPQAPNPKGGARSAGAQLEAARELARMRAQQNAARPQRDRPRLG